MANHQQAMTEDILIVDDESDIRTLVSGILEDEGYEAREAADGDETLAAVSVRRPSLILLDIWLQGSRLDGMQILERLKQDHPSVPVVIMSGHGTIETAVQAIKLGAYDFIEKPFKADRMILRHQAGDRSRAAEAGERRAADARRQWPGADRPIDADQSAAPFHRPGGADQQPRADLRPCRLRQGDAGPAHSRPLAPRFRPVRRPELRLDVARAHGSGAVRRRGFGEGASPRKVGTFEAAHNGTLLLDEVADLPPETQGKIVRVLQEQIFQRVGGETRVDVNVRVIASTTRDLSEEIRAGRFREDLFYRLSVVPLRVPALSERRDDIPLLARHFMARAAESSGQRPREISEDAMAALQTYDWPGNVRELRNIIERLLIMAPGGVEDPIRADMLPAEFDAKFAASRRSERSSEIMGLPLKNAREIFEREYLLAQVSRFGGNISRTAAFVGMERSALHRKLKSLGIQGDDKPRLPATSGGRLRGPKAGRR